MSNPEPSQVDEAARRRKWAIVRLVLGQAQIIGATATLVLLVTRGTSNLTIWAAVISAVITGVSLVLFRSRWKVMK